MSRMSIVLTALPITFALEFEPGASVVLELIGPDGRQDRFAPPGIGAPPAGPVPQRMRLTAAADGLDVLVLPPGEPGVRSHFAHPLAVGSVVILVIRDPFPWPAGFGGAAQPAPAAARPSQDTGQHPFPSIAPTSARACPRHGISPPEACPLCR